MPNSASRTTPLRPGLPAGSTSTPGEQEYGWGSGWVNQLDAGFEGFQDNATMGGFDQIRAAVEANPFSRGWYDRYSRNIDYEHKRDQWQAQNYGLARTGGKILGVLVPIGAAGKVEIAANLGKRIIQATPALLREKAVLGAGGAAFGAGSQGFSDWATGHRSSVGDYAGAGLGGALDAYLLMSGRAGRAGTIGAGATSMMQDIFNGRMPSAGKAADNATTGGYFGLASGKLGRSFAQNLSRKAKENAGETLSKIRTLTRGDTTATTDKTRLYLANRKFTLPDQRTALDQYVEAKFGLAARLSRNQRQAWSQPDLNYRVDHWLPRDVGSALAFPSVQFSYQAGQSADARRQRVRRE
jgi:hypothetical protein